MKAASPFLVGLDYYFLSTYIFILVFRYLFVFFFCYGCVPSGYIIELSGYLLGLKKKKIDNSHLNKNFKKIASLSLIGKFLMCKPFNKRAAQNTLRKA